ncbi:MAG: PilZ domain-containing protein [Anaerolineaceae bacterium]
MENIGTLRFGDRVTLVSVGDGGHATTFAATVSSRHGNAVEVTLEPPFEGVSRPYLLVSGEAEAGHYIAIEESADPGTQLSAAALGPWQNPAEKRASARFPTYRPCRLVTGETAVEGRILDLSLDGIAIEAVSWEAEHFTLRVEAGDGEIDLPCQAVGFQHTVGDLVVVHARFEPLTVAEGQAVADLGRSARAEFEAAQLRLVSAGHRSTRSLRVS